VATDLTMFDLVTTVCDLFEKDGAASNVSNPRPLVFPPVSDLEVRAFEKRLEHQLPPSYVEFLSVTNGMVGYQGVFTLLGATGEHTERAMVDIAKRRQLYSAAWESKHGAATEATVAAFEAKMDLSKKKEDDAQIFPGNKLMIGTDFLGSLFYFVEPVSQARPEPKVVWRDNLARLVVYDSLREMFERNIRVLSRRLGLLT
jgi:hypothetical protein